MSWPVPAPGVIAERFAVGFETALSTDADGRPLPDTVDARTPNTALRVLGVVGEEVWTEAYLYQRSLADELMIDTAQDTLPRHAAEWGVPALPPLTSLGTLLFVGAPGTPLPAGIEAYAGALRWATNAAATIPAGGVVEVPAEARLPGVGSDLVAGAVLTLVSPVAGLTAQTATVGADGFRGGRDAEDIEDWRGRILARVRDRGKAGATGDYKAWAQAGGADPNYVHVIPRWVGAGSVGVAVAMGSPLGAGPRVVTEPERQRIAAAIDAERPVTANVVTLAATLLPVPVQLAISPDTVVVRQAVTLALQGFFLREGRIGIPVPLSRLSAAISSAGGEYAQRIEAPWGDVIPAATQLPVLGPIAWVTGGVPAPP